MELKEYYNYRSELFEEANDEGFINESQFLDIVMPKLLDAKLVDSEEYNDTYFNQNYEGLTLKINGYAVNETGERLQLFIVNEDSIDPELENIEISDKSYYDKKFKKAVDFIKKARNGNLDEIQDEGAINALINQLSSQSGANKFDVFEIFLVSATTSIETRGPKPSPKRYLFNDEFLKVSYSIDNQDRNKEILILKKLIDLNYLFDILMSHGEREELIIDFKNDFNFSLNAIKAADELNFTSFLCVIPAVILEKLYLRYSSRLLEKNVRSFLQFKGVNKGIKQTLLKEPEKFIAYNNGLTITAKDMKVEEIENGLYLINSLSDFQIVNGGQTTASIYFSNKEGIDITGVKIMAKINVAKNSSSEQLDELISKISLYSNSQSKVSSVDLKSRDPQLTKIKALSTSIITPTNKKWFYEKAKGEFNTMLRIAGSSKKHKINKEYPQNQRFTSEQLGKYSSAWGMEPFDVKKGGEKIFRKFLEFLNGDGNDIKIEINRNFYELLIAKIILFRNLENIYGSGKNAIGQLRAAVVPYTISILYTFFDGNKKKGSVFNLFKLWKNEGLENDLIVYCRNLMSLVNDLLKKYSKSDDVSEASKNKELWDSIINSKEINEFATTEDSLRIFTRYSISKREFEEIFITHKNRDEIDFSYLSNNISIHSKTSKFYKLIIDKYSTNLTKIQLEKLELICHRIANQKEIPDTYIDFSNYIIDELRFKMPEIFDSEISENENLTLATEFLISEYNYAITNNKEMVSYFDRLDEIAKKKGLKYDSIFVQIGRQLNNGLLPTIEQIYLISTSISDITKFVSQTTK